MKNLRKTALTALYLKYFEDLLDYGIRINNNKIIVEECIQDMFITLYSSNLVLDEIKNPNAYLFTVLRRDILKRLKKVKAEKDQERKYVNETNFQFTRTDILPQLDSNVSNVLIEALNDIPWRQREALYLKYYNGMKTSEIAEVMQVTDQTILNTLCLGLKKLRNKVNLKDVVRSILPFFTILT